MKYYCDIYQLNTKSFDALVEIANIDARAFLSDVYSKERAGDFFRPSDKFYYMKNRLNDIFRQKRLGVRVI